MFSSPVDPGQNVLCWGSCEHPFMDHQEITYDFMAYTSTLVLEAIESLPPGAVFFISRGAQITHPKVKVLFIDGKKPGDVDYPYYQMFYLVTNRSPAGTVETFVDFTPLFPQSGSGA